MQRWQSLLFLSLVLALAACTPPNPKLSVELAGDGSGTVTSTTENVVIDCGDTCEASAPVGTVITLTAVADEDSSFEGWGGACAGAVGTSCTVKLDKSENVVATFAAGTGGTITSSVGDASDDAEENVATGEVDLISSDLEITFDNNFDELGFNQVVGLRFTDLAIPQGATIVDAYIQFTVDETNDDAVADDEVANISINAEAIADAPEFVSTLNNLTARLKTTAAVAWTPAEWTEEGLAGEDQKTSNIATVVQEIVSLEDWESGNAMAFFLSGDGQRVAESFEGGAAPTLVVEFE